MLVRALIVVLLVLNLGVAVWWLSRPAVPGPVLPESDAGGALLQLVPAQAPVPRATTPSSTSAYAPASQAPAAAADAAVPACVRAGPFAELAALESIRLALAPLSRGSVVDEIPGEAAGYRVLLPPQADRAAAQALAQRVAAAGFQDYLVLNQGEETNAVALGSYRSRDTALRRVQALREAGFGAQLRAQGKAAPSQWWLELETTRLDAVRVRLAGVDTTECVLPRGDGREGGALH